MARDKVFMSRSYHPEATALLKEHFEVEVWQEASGPTKEVLIQKAREYAGLFVESYDKVDGEILQAASALRVVSNRAVGTNNLDIEEATRQGILIGNTPGVLHEACADITFGLMLAVARKVAFGDHVVRSGRWTELTQLPYIGTDVYGKTLGIVGMGQIGQAVARRARGFDMTVLYFSRTTKPQAEEEIGARRVDDLYALLGEADYVSLHVPLSPETEQMFGKEEFGRMKADAFFVNTSRGRTIDQKALYEALASGQIAGAALDVTDPEPLPADDPLIGLPNVVITPHIASGSSATFKTMALMAAENVIAALTGQPMPSCLNPEALQNR